MRSRPEEPPPSNSSTLLSVPVGEQLCDDLLLGLADLLSVALTWLGIGGVGDRDVFLGRLPRFLAPLYASRKPLAV